MLQHFFTFFLRLLFAFLAAKLLTLQFGLEGLGYWLGITLFFVGNVYFFDYLDYRGHSLFRARLSPRRDASPPTPPSTQPPPEA